MPPKRRVAAHATRTRWDNERFGKQVAINAFGDLDDFRNRTFGFYVDRTNAQWTYRAVVTGAHRFRNNGSYHSRTHIHIDTHRYFPDGTLDQVFQTIGDLRWFFDGYLWGWNGWADFRRFYDDPPPNVNPVGVDCALCLESVDSVQEAKILGCGHVFHLDCWNNYLGHQNLDPFAANYRTCPLCRQIVRQSRKNKSQSRKKTKRKT